jgi:hypothetical protein
MKRWMMISCCLLALACQENEFSEVEASSFAACGVGNAEDLPWLQDMLAQYNGQGHGCPILEVIQGVYQKETVFMVYAGGPACLTCTGAQVVDCEGNTLFVCEPEKDKKIKKRKLVWKK